MKRTKGREVQSGKTYERFGGVMMCEGYILCRDAHTATNVKDVLGADSQEAVLVPILFDLVHDAAANSVLRL